MKIPRPYQNAASTAIWEWINTQRQGNPLVVMPVGAGKSYQIARLIREVHAFYPRTRIVVLAHVKELLEQNAEELRIEYPTCDYDFYCAGLGRKKLHNDVTFASIQSVVNKVHAFSRCPSIIIVDECHLISHNDATTYRKFIDGIKAINPNAIIIGFTGSPFRADTGRLDEGDGAIFDGIAYEIPISYMIKEGYLVRPIIPHVKTKLDPIMANGNKVPMRAGDYAPGQLEKAVDIDEKTKACVAEVIALAGDRVRWFGMTAGVLHCTHVRDEFRANGIDCEMIDGETETDERRRVIAWFKEEPIPGEPPRCLVNIGTLNVGFNAIYIDLLFPMRPTRSPVLYTQYTGRGLRPVYAYGYDLSTTQGRLDAIANSIKPNVMFLDFGDIIKELGPIDGINISKKHVKKDEDAPKGDATFKICPGCGALCAPAQKYCYSCGYNFVSDSINAKAETEAPILVADIKPRKFKVIFCEYKRHEKRLKPGEPPAPPTLRCEYVTTNGTFREFVPFESTYFSGRQRAARWFFERLPGVTMPKTVDEALLYAGGHEIAPGRIAKCYYPDPAFVMVRKNGKYDEVLGVDFDSPPEEPVIDEADLKLPEEKIYNDEIPF